MSKFTFVAGCDALAWPKRGCISTPAAAAPNTNSRRAIMIASLLKAHTVGSSLSAKRRHCIFVASLSQIRVQANGDVELAIPAVARAAPPDCMSQRLNATEPAICYPGLFDTRPKQQGPPVDSIARFLLTDK